MSSDKGVRANLLDRHFGSAGRGSDLTRHAHVAERRAARRDQKQAVADLHKPLKPPGRPR